MFRKLKFKILRYLKRIAVKKCVFDVYISGGTKTHPLPSFKSEVQFNTFEEAEKFKERYKYDIRNRYMYIVPRFPKYVHKMMRFLECM